MSDVSRSEAGKPVAKDNLLPVGIDWPVFIISGGFVIAFVVMALIDIDSLSKVVNTTFAWSTKLFGAYWQVLLLLTFFIGLGLAFSRLGGVRLGNTSKPDFTTFKWIAIIMCTLLAGGGVFWAAAEPIAHFISPPPLFGVKALSKPAAYAALAQAYLHWGFLAWAIQCSLTSIVMMHLHFNKGLPLKPRTLLYPVFGEKIYNSWYGALTDAVCVIAVVAGTVGPIGFLGLQVGYGFEKLFGIANNYTTQLLIIIFLICIYTVSAVSGVHRGIQLLSRMNVFLAVALMIFILLFGPTAFIIDSFLNSTGLYLKEFFPMTLYRADPGWLDWWTVFFWGWFLGYGPLMAMFIAKISNGRTIRSMVFVVSILAPLVTAFWFTILGGTGIAFELQTPGIISEPFTGFNLPAALFAMTLHLPMGFLISVLFLILTLTFVATTGDSMTLTVAMVMTGTEHPPAGLRVFWGIMMGTLAAILISLGSGGVSALQSFIVVTAVPVSLVLLPSLWNGPQIAKELAKEQGLIK